MKRKCEALEETEEGTVDLRKLCAEFKSQAHAYQKQIFDNQDTQEELKTRIKESKEREKKVKYLWHVNRNKY